MDPKDTTSNIVALPARSGRAVPAPAFSCVAAHRCLTLMLYWSSRGEHAAACGEIRARIVRGRWQGQIYMPLSRETCALVVQGDLEAAIRHLDALFRQCTGL